MKLRRVSRYHVDVDVVVSATGKEEGWMMARVRSQRIAPRAAPRAVPAGLATFSYSSIVAAPAAEVFRWHEQPNALAALTPSWVRIEQQQGGVRDGGRVTVSAGIGPVRIRWVLRHYGYEAGRCFCDEQEAGPFTVWRHAHLFQAIGRRETLYRDCIEWAVGGGRVLNVIAGLMLRPLLRIAFAHRHRVVRQSIEANSAAVDLGI